ncbi:hypothetical protein [Aliarcobacter butzleri]|uniref:hypothetical protein n=1 Tax=Aliarcobacter butzleri TaxID=28197 RepID=UPI002B240837|nr:hypothetical protein [Aliarcobacter butzleri]
MKKIIVSIISPLFLVASLNEANLNDIQQLVDHKNKKILILNKKDLNEYLKSNKLLKANEDIPLKINEKPFQEIIIDNSNNSEFEKVSNVETNKMVDKKISKVNDQSLTIEKPKTSIIKETVVQKENEKINSLVEVNITNYNEYINNIHVNSKKNIKMNLVDLLKATKYLFDNNLENKYKEEIKANLLKVAKEDKNIDYAFFEEAVSNMNQQTINELVSNFE